jgi:large subunit ribosomal protein L3
MARGLLGTKLGMTQVFTEEGIRIGVTAIRVAGNVVVEKKSETGKNGYAAVKIGYGEVHKHVKEGCEDRWRLSKPEVGVFAKAGIEEPRKHLREFRISEKELENYEVGQELGAEFFSTGEYVDVTGTSKGHGFTGVMVRHNFHGAKSSHGVHEFFRHGGSIGMSADPAKVFKGTKMAGQHGNKRVTVQSVKVEKTVAEEGIILVKGSVPGPTGAVVMVRAAAKKLSHG